MTVVRNGLGHNSPIFPIHFTLESIAAADFDPITTLHDATHVHPVELNASEVGAYSQKGFLVRPNADGDLWVITWKQWHFDGRKSFTDRLGVDLVPVCWNGVANEWCEIPVVKVFAHTDETYPATATEINVGIIL